MEEQSVSRPLSLVVFTLAALACGCAKVEVVDVATHPTTDGIRFYRPDIYMLVTSQVDTSGKPTGGKDIKFIPLPNMKQEYAIRQASGIGTTEIKPVLTDGWNLTSLDATQDSKVPETISAVSSLLTAAAGIATAFHAQPGAAGPLQDGLYRLNFDKTTGQISGLQRIGPNT
jgi:hypothetical protein